MPHDLALLGLIASSYELELRKEAIRLCKEQSYGIQERHCGRRFGTRSTGMKHWLQLLAIPNAPSSSSNQELQSLRKRISDLEKARSRSPRRNLRALPAPSAPLALPAPPAPATRTEGELSVDIQREELVQAVLLARVKLSQFRLLRDFDFIMKIPVEFRANFHEKFHKKEIYLLQVLEERLR